MQQFRTGAILPTRMVDEWKIIALDDDHCVASWKNVGITIWRRATTKTGLELSVRTYNDLVRVFPRGVSWLVVVERLSMPPDETVRKLVSDAMSRMTGMKALAAVHEGIGFQSAATRAVAASLSWSGKLEFPRRIFTGIEDAALWLASEGQMRGAPEALCRVLGQIREKVACAPRGTVLTSSPSTPPPSVGPKRNGD